MSSLELNPEQEPIIICIAGHCSGNPGQGSWSAVLLWQGKSKRISGEASSTTNNQMIITAAVEAFKLLKKPCKVKLYTNSEYIISAFKNNWIDTWAKAGWRNSAGKQVSNVGLWRELSKAQGKHDVLWIKSRLTPEMSDEDIVNLSRADVVDKRAEAIIKTKHILNSLITAIKTGEVCVEDLKPSLRELLDLIEAKTLSNTTPEDNG